MKTPQEEAEELIGKAIAKYDQGYAADGFRFSCIEQAILQEIPLAELIAVARAAKEYAGTISECCMTGDCTGEVCELHCALQALRATGKVEM